MEKIKNLSIQKTIILYMTIGMIISFAGSAMIIRAAEQTQTQVWSKYVEMDKFYKAVNQEDGYKASVPRPSRQEMSKPDWHISELCDFLETYSVLVISVLCSTVAMLLFYKHKIKEPVCELAGASEMISRNELDFSINYSSRDELGELCDEFEKMRRQLAQNNKELWDMVEKEKVLRAAIAHDIRSPFAILKGYQEMLLEFIPQEVLDKEKILEMLREGNHQIDRINGFIETMRRLSSLEDREIKYQETDLEEFIEKIRKNVSVMAKSTGKICHVTGSTGVGSIRFDPSVVMEVTENIVSNSLRYAKKEINILIAAVGRELEITVTDDGKGFQSQEKGKVGELYHANLQDDLKHFGLGMYISRIYCEKHDGRLLAGNQRHGGAVVKAVFGMEE